MNVKKSLFLVIMLIVIFVQIVCAQGLFSFNVVPKTRPSQEEWCFDYSKVLNDEVRDEINDEGRGIKKSFDIDFVVAVIPSINGRDINEYAVEMFTNWEIGKNTQGKKGILILVVKDDQKVRIEIGYDLEGIYTDQYVGQVEREILKEFLEQADWNIGFLATIENFLFRIYNKDLQQEVNGITSKNDNLNYYSQGAGASNVFDFGAALKKQLPSNYSELKVYFSAQETPEQTFQRYMELISNNVTHNNDLTIFTNLSNKFWAGWTSTSGQRRAEAEEISGKQYVIKQKDDHAVVFFPETDPEKLKKAPMYFLFKANNGWQVDIYTMARTMRCVGPGWWIVTDLFHPYSEIILEDYNLVSGFLTPWNSDRGYNPYYILDTYFYDQNEPGIHIGVSEKYYSVSNLRRGDSVLFVDGIKMNTDKQVWDIFENTKAGDKHDFTILRNGKKIIVTETAMGSPDGFKNYRPCLNIPRMWMGVYMIQSLDKEWRHTMKLRDQGKFRYSSLCAILDVYPGSPADKAGLKPDDLIVDYGMNDDNGEIMPLDVVEALYKIKPGDSINLTIVRDLDKIIKIKIIPEETSHRGYF